MNSSFQSLLLTVCLLLLSAQLSAQAIVHGRVTDANTGEPLPGTALRVVKTSRGAISDVYGEYTLRLPAGSYQLSVSYLGYELKTLDLTVKSGEDRTLPIALTPRAYEVEGVTVIGRLQGQQKALNQQRNAGNIKNIVAAEQIGRFPDPNTAEAVQRIPGVTLQRDQGEGRFVIVRGLAPQFTTTNINGVQIPSPEADVRFVALDAIPANQLASIEVSKTLTPDMDGDAIGGNVNLVTRKASSGDLSVQGSLNGGYNNLMGKPNGQYSLALGKRFGKNEQLGVLVNSSYNFSDIGSDNWERDGDEMELRDYALRRTRLGVSTSLDYRFDPRNELYVRGMYNSFTDREFRRAYVFVPDVDDSPFEDHEIERATKDRLEIQDIASVTFGGTHNLPSVSISYSASYSRSLQDTPYDNEIGFKAEPDDLSLDFDSNPEFPRFSTDEGFDYRDNRNYAFDEVETGGTLTLDENWQGDLNLGIPYSFGANQGTFKFGGRVRLKTKDLTVRQNAFEWEGADDLTLDQFEGGLVDDNFLGGEYEISANVDPDRFFEFFNENRNGFALDTESKLVDERVESFTVSENVFAGYAMTDVQLGKLQAIAGVRYEYTDVDYDYFTVLYDREGDLDEIQPNSGGTNFDYLLPSLNLRYALGTFTNLRGAITWSYARPNFGAVVPSQEIELGEREGTVGNPELTPVDALNLDLLGEHYFGNTGIIGGGVFYKQLDGFIFTRRFRTDNFGGNQFGEQIELFQFANGETANLFGAEINYQQNLTFLPGALSGLGLYLNYTFTTSSADIQSREGELDELETIDLPGQASHVANVSLAYTWKGFNARLSLNYHDRYLDELDSSPEDDFYIEERLQLDFNTYYILNNRWTLFLEATNLTNAPFQIVQGPEGTIVQREFYSWWSRLGVKFQF